jgi:hypothetical protein
MANYVCKQLVDNTCTTWVEISPSFWEHLAITSEQADQIIFSLLIVFVTAFGYRQVTNVILQRKY